jgi:GT2 family glycosyltransferase
MRDCLILGSGRSGTSMVTGTLARAGYFMGDDLYRPRAANPKGFFECAEVNGINEALLAPVVPADQGLGENQRWLAVLPAPIAPVCAPAVEARIQRATTKTPFCYKDPRFSYTLPAWRPHLGDAGLVCVFRDPRLTAHSIAKEVRTAAYLDGLPFDEARALALWTATYRTVVHDLRQQGDWLFLHYDQVLTQAGMGRLGQFLGATPDGSFPDALLQRRAPEGPVPEEAAELYAELCELAGHTDPARVTTRARITAPDLSVVALATPADRAALTRLQAAVADQRHAHVELVVVDTSEAGALSGTPGVTVVHAPGWSRAAAWKQGVAAARGRHIAGWEPGAVPLPAAYAHAVRALDADLDADVILAPFWRARPPEDFVARVDPGEGDPPPGWRAATVWRRTVLDTLCEDVAFPAELAHLRMLRTAGRVRVATQPLFAIDERTCTALEPGERRDRHVLDAQALPWAGPPAVSVILCTYDRVTILRECLGALCHQAMPLGSYEIVIVDDGSTDGTSEALAAVTFPVPVQVVRRDNGGLAAARNTGIAKARGALLYLLNDDTIPAVDAIAEHLEAHHAHPGEPIAVLGTFEQPRAALDNALMRACESSTLVFCYSELRPNEFHHPRYFYTCNITVPTALVRSVGGFDERFRHYGAEDTDLGYRLGALGLRVLYHPKARATHRHTWNFDYLARRNRQVARAHVRLFAQHPTAMDVFGCHARTRAELEAQLSRRAAGAPQIEAAARGLAALDLAALEALGVAWRPYVQESLKRLLALLQDLNAAWWAQGFLDGLDEHGVDGFRDLLVRHPLPSGSGPSGAGGLPPPRNAPRPEPRVATPARLVCFPSGDGDWRGVVRRFAASGPVDAMLVLVADTGVEYGATALAWAVDALAHGAGRRRVTVFDPGVGHAHDVRVIAGAEGWVPTGSHRDPDRAAAAQASGVATVSPRTWAEPWPLASSSPFRLLAWPDWSDEAALGALLSGFGRPLAEDGGTLVLRLDPERDGPAEAATARLTAAADRTIADLLLDVLVVDEPMDADAVGRLVRSVDAVTGARFRGHPRVVSDARGLAAAWAGV